MRKLSVAMNKALDELIRVAEYTKERSVNNGWRPALICLKAREPTLNALVRRGMAEMKISHIPGFPSIPMKEYRILISYEVCEIMRGRIG